MEMSSQDSGLLILEFDRNEIIRLIKIIREKRKQSLPTNSEETIIKVIRSSMAHTYDYKKYPIRWKYEHSKSN